FGSHCSCSSPSRRGAGRVPATSGKWVVSATAGARQSRRRGRIGLRCDRRSDPGEATVRQLGRRVTADRGTREVGARRQPSLIGARADCPAESVLILKEGRVDSPSLSRPFGPSLRSVLGPSGSVGLAPSCSSRLLSGVCPSSSRPSGPRILIVCSRWYSLTVSPPLVLTLRLAS